MADDPAALLAPIRERHALATTPDPDPVLFGSLFQAKSHLVRADVPRLLAAVEAALKLPDKWKRFAARGDAQDECADELRAVIAAELTGGGSHEPGH